MAPTAALADGLATLLMVADPKHAGAITAGFPGCAFLLVSKTGDLTTSRDLPLV